MALIREFQGVPDQVIQDLLYPVFVRSRQRQALADVVGQPDVLHDGQRLKDIRHHIGRPLQVDFLDDERHVGMPQLGEIEMSLIRPDSLLPLDTTMAKLLLASSF